MPYQQPLAATNATNSYNAVQALKPTVLNTPAARAREAERQQKFHNLQKKNLPLATLGEKPLKLLLECVQVGTKNEDQKCEFQMAQDFIRIFPTQASVKRYGHMIGIGSTAKSMSASQLLCLALFNEPRLARARNGNKGGRGGNGRSGNKSQSSSPVKVVPQVDIDDGYDFNVDVDVADRNKDGGPLASAAGAGGPSWPLLERSRGRSGHRGAGGGASAMHPAEQMAQQSRRILQQMKDHEAYSEASGRGAEIQSSSASSTTVPIGGGASTPASSDVHSELSAGQDILSTHNFYWSSSVVSTEGSKRGLEALERRVNLGASSALGGGNAGASRAGGPTRTSCGTRASATGRATTGTTEEVERQRPLVPEKRVRVPKIGCCSKSTEPEVEVEVLGSPRS
eukprot:g18912.t1